MQDAITAVSIAAVFFFLGEWLGRRRMKVTEVRIKGKVEEALAAINVVGESATTRLQQVQGILSDTQTQIEDLPKAAQRMDENSKSFTSRFESWLGSMRGSVDDLKSFASTISLMKERGFEMEVLNKASTEQREEIGQVPEKVFVMFPRRKWWEILRDTALTAGTTVIAQKAAGNTSEHTDDINEQLETISEKLDQIEAKLNVT